MASEALQKVIEALRARELPADLSWEERRAGIERMQAQLEIPADVVSEPADADGVPVEWISLPGSDPERTLLYLHGGGYALCSVDTHRHLMQAIARTAAVRVLGVDYRLAPEHPFPAAVEDAATACRWAFGSGLEPERTAIAGDSAGGGLTLATLLTLRDAGDQLPAAAVCLSPWVDLASTAESIVAKQQEDPMVDAATLGLMAAAYLGGADPRHPLASPLYAELTGLPPLLLQVGSAELLLDDSTRLAERAEAMGVEVTLEIWEEMLHVFQGFPSLPEAQQAIDGIGAFVRRYIA